MRSDDSDEMYYSGVQSSEMCTVLVMADARDKSHMYADVFSEFYAHMEHLGREGLPASEYGPALCPFTITYPSDLKAIWTTSGRGGNCNATTFFCHLCVATKDDLVSWQEGCECCPRCKNKGKAKCYHHDVGDSTTTD